MIKHVFLCLISTLIFNNYNISSASNTINNNCLKDDLKQEEIDNTKHNQQYWDEFLPTIKCDARETLKDRFEYCTDRLVDFITHDFYNRARAIDNYKYEVDELKDIFDIEKLKCDISLRKQLFNCMCEKHKLKGHAWSAIPIRIFSYNEDHHNKIGKCLFLDSKLLHNHWDMKFDHGFNNIRLNLYSSYEYQEPKFYEKSLDSEKTLSICLSAIEMDLLTSNNITSNIELFASHLISRKNNCAVEAINRYEKYFTEAQKAQLAKHIISYYFSSLEKKKDNVAKHLINKYLLGDLFRNMKPNQFLKYIKKYRPDDWFDIVIKQYLNNEFGTNYNKDHLNSLQNVIINNMQLAKEMMLPTFRQYVAVILTKLVDINRKIMNFDDKYLETRDTKTLTFPLTDAEWTSGLLALAGLNCPSSNKDYKSMENIIRYLNLSPKYKIEAKSKSTKK